MVPPWTFGTSCAVTTGGFAADAKEPKGEAGPEAANAATIRLATDFRAGAIAHSRVLPTLVAEESAPFAGTLQSGAGQA
jgi:hypothetical protein